MRCPWNIALPGALLLLLASACHSPGAVEMCNQLDDICTVELDLDDCRRDARELEREAEDANCGSAMDGYLECVDNNTCNWESACIAQRATLKDCVGDFP